MTFQKPFPLLVGSVAVLALIVFFGMKMFSSDGAGDAVAQTASSGQNWSIRCADGWKEGQARRGQCEMFQRLSVAETNQRVMEFALSYKEGDGDVAKGLMIMPLGILVQVGAVITIEGEEPMSAKPTYCDATGCVALMGLTSDILEKFKKAPHAKVTYKAVDGKDFTVEMPLKGFTAALKKIQS